MKRLALCVLLLTGCGAHQAKVKHPAITVPGKCIVGGVVNQAKCRAISDTELVCDGVVVKIACVEVREDKR